MDCFEYILDIYNLFTTVIKELNTDSINILNKYNGLDD